MAQETLSERLDRIRQMRQGGGSRLSPDRAPRSGRPPPPPVDNRPWGGGGGKSPTSLITQGGNRGFWGSLGKNTQNFGKSIVGIPVGLASLGIDVGKTAADVATEASRVTPWVSGDVYDPGNRSALGSIPRSFGDTWSRLQPLVRATGYTQPVAAPGPTRDVHVATAQPYFQAWREGNLFPVLTEDIGNVAAVIGGTGAAVRATGAIGRGGVAARAGSLAERTAAAEAAARTEWAARVAAERAAARTAAPAAPLRTGLVTPETLAAERAAELAARQGRVMPTATLPPRPIAPFNIPPSQMFPGPTQPLRGPLITPPPRVAPPGGPPPTIPFQFTPPAPGAVGRVVDRGLQAAARQNFRPPRITGLADAREARAVRRGEVGDRLLGRGDRLTGVGNRLDRLTLAPVTVPLRLAERGLSRGYSRLMNVDPALGGTVGLARDAALRFETGGAMRNIEDAGRRRIGGNTQAFATIQNIIAGKDRSPAARRLVEDKFAAYDMIRMGVDPDALFATDPAVRAARRAGTEGILAERRAGKPVERAKVTRLRAELASQAEVLSRQFGETITPEAVEYARRYRQGLDAEELSRIDEAYAEVERLQDETLESADRPYEGTEPVDEDGNPLSEEELADLNDQKMAAIADFYQKYGVEPPDWALRELPNDRLFSEAQRGDEMLPPRYNTPLREGFKAERKLMADRKIPRLAQKRAKLAQKLEKKYPDLFGPVQQNIALRRGLESLPTSDKVGRARQRRAIERTERQVNERIMDAGPVDKTGARRRTVERLQKLVERESAATARMQSELDRVARSLDELQTTVIAAPARFRPAMMAAQTIAGNLEAAAKTLEDISPGLGPSAKLLRDEAAGMPVSIARVTDAADKAGVELKYVPGGQAEPGGAGTRTAHRLSGLRMRESGTMDITLSGQHAIDLIRGREATRSVAEDYIAGSELGRTSLDVLGEQPRLRGPLLLAEMRKRGFVPARRTDAVKPTAETVFIPKAIRDSFEAYFERDQRGKGVQLYQGGMFRWKRGQLGLSPRWLIGNFVGDVMMAKVHADVRFRDMPRLMRESVATGYALRGLTEGSLNPAQRALIGGTHAAALDGKLRGWVESGEFNRLSQVFSHQLRLNPELGDYHLNKLMDDARQRVMSTENWTQQQLNDAMETAVTEHLASSFDGTAESWKHHPLRNLIDTSFKINTFMDDTVRGMVYLDEIYKRGGPDNVTPVVAEQALESALKAIGNYASMSNFERRWISMVFPFWSWVRHITKASVRLPIEHPFRTAWMLHLATVGIPEEYYDEDVRTAGSFPLGGDRYAPMNWLNPWAGSVAANLWQTEQDNPVSAALGFVAENVTPAADYAAELGFGQTFDATGPNQFMRPLGAEDRAYGPTGFRNTSQSLFGSALSGDIHPLLWRTGFYNPLTRTARDTYAELGGLKRTETGDIDLREGEPVESPYGPLMPVSRLSGLYAGPGAVVFDTEEDRKRRLEAQKSAAERARS